MRIVKIIIQAANNRRQIQKESVEPIQQSKIKLQIDKSNKITLKHPQQFDKHLVQFRQID